MLRLSIIVCFIALSLAKPPDVKIVGGHDVDIKDYPHQISLLLYGMHMCGGSIIDKTHILTAAHCTYGRSTAGLQIRAGSSLLKQGGTVINVKEIHQHPLYNNWITDYDAAVLELCKPLKFGPGIGAINLTNSELPEGTEVEITGWGLTEEDGYLSDQLQGVTVPIISRNECRSFYGNSEITDRMICAGLDEGGKDACEDDSGGPLIHGNTQYGIVSWGDGCAEAGHPGVYSNVAALRDFIDSVV